jgi:hypothetical protein
MQAIFRGFLAGLVCLVIFGALSIAGATTQGDISSSHWAYQAIDHLAQQGLLAGYPASPYVGPQDLTRLEAASLVLRGLEGVAAAYQEQGMTIAKLVQPAAPAPRKAAAKAEKAPVASPEDLAVLEKLIAEFRTELAGMGVKVGELEETIKATQKRLDKVEAEQRLHQLNGYMQFRFTDDESKSASTFSLRRIRFGMKGVLSPRTSYAICFRRDDSDKNVDLDDAYLDLSTGKTSRLRAGQAKLPVGYEVLESPSDRYEPETTLAMDRLFPKSRDIGMQWQIQTRAQRPIFNLGVFNGTGINTVDDNDRKDVLASVQVPLKSGSIFLSDYQGRTSSDQDKDRFVIGLDQGAKTRLRAEYIAGKDKGEDVMGWYTRLSQQFTKEGTAYAKYEVFDEDRDSSNDLYRALSLGWVQELDPRTRLTLSWEHRNVDKDFSEYSTKHGDRAILQLQVKY